MMLRRGVQTDEIGMYYEIDRTALRFASQPEAAIARAQIELLLTRLIVVLGGSVSARL